MGRAIGSSDASRITCVNPLTGLVLTARRAALQMGGDHRALELGQLSVQPDGDLATNPFTDKRPNRSHACSDEPRRRELASSARRALRLTPIRSADGFSSSASGRITSAK